MDVSELQENSQRPSDGLSPAEMVGCCQDALRSYCSAQVTLDAHLESYMNTCRKAAEEDKIFISQVVYGVERYGKFLSYLLDSFYHHNGASALRVDGNMYRILGYLAVFRLQELGLPQFNRLLLDLDPQKVVVFMRYILDEQMLKEVCREDWLKLYDKQFVDDLITGLLASGPEIQPVLKMLEAEVFLKSNKDSPRQEGVPARAKPSSVVPQPFNLTQPKPKPPPPSTPPPPPAFKSKPAPIFNTGPTREEVALMAAKEANRKLLEAKYQRSSSQAFKLKILERPPRVSRVVTALMEEQQRELTFQPVEVAPPPPNPVAEVKLNTAAVLREDALYKRKQQEEAEMLKRYEQDLRDASQFDEWRRLKLIEDEASRAAEVAERKLLMEQAQQAAIKAKLLQVAKNQEASEQLRAVLEKERQEVVVKQEELLEQNQERVSQITADRAKAGLAVEMAVEVKKQAAEQVRRQQVEDAHRKAEQEAKEMAEKKDLIMKLRALLKVPRPRVKAFDPTSTPDQGLLDQMSLVELRERLAREKQRQVEEEEAHRERIIQMKQEKADSLLKKVDNIKRIRTLAAMQADMRKKGEQQQMKMKEEGLALSREVAVMALNDKLEHKRAKLREEKDRLAAERKAIAFTQMQQQAGAMALEEKKFAQLRAGERRQLVESQKIKREAARVTQATHLKEQATRSLNREQAAAEKEGFLRSYDEQLHKLQGEAKETDKEVLAKKTARVKEERCREKEKLTLRQQKAYQPFAGEPPSLQRRLQALGAGEEIK